VEKSWKDIAKTVKEGEAVQSLPTSINDVRDKYFNAESLNEEELEALSRFDNYRIWYLNSANGEWEFHQRYEELQAKANLSPFSDFLSKKYDLPTQ
jgi:hypothetical protein